MRDTCPQGCEKWRSYDDFLIFVEENDSAAWVEMDTVIGRQGGKVIMTLLFTFCIFMAGLLLENKSLVEVATKIRKLKATFTLNGHRFGDKLPLILTDNGGEFSNVAAFEYDSSEVKETNLFFCDPMQSCQKPRVEKNHTLFRDIVPKGKSFDDFTQERVNLIFSHINSTARNSLNGKTPYELFCFAYGKDIAEIFGIRYIPALQVIQSPKLLKL